jgi:hypothetical protein
MSQTRRIIIAYTTGRGRSAKRDTVSVDIPADATNIRVAAELDVEVIHQDKGYVKVRIDGTSNVYTFRTHARDRYEIEEGDRVTFQISASEGPKFGTVIGFGKGGYNGATRVAWKAR